MYVPDLGPLLDSESDAIQMSLRLKLNALHFASSLNEEKPLVDTSTLVLESTFTLSLPTRMLTWVISQII